MGRFYFKMTANGNLVGEYSHRDSTPTRCYAEAATRISDDTGWTGRYITTWCEAPKCQCESAELSIQARPNGIYALEWMGDKGKRLFSGEAMRCNDTLVGDYTNK